MAAPSIPLAQQTDLPPLAGGPNPALVVVSVASALALYALPFQRLAANRLVTGEAVDATYLLQAAHNGVCALAWGVVAALAVLLACGLLKPRQARHAQLGLWLSLAAAASVIPALVALAGLNAQAMVQAQSPLARVSLASGFWVGIVGAGLTVADTLQRLRAGGLLKALVVLAIWVPVALMLAMGWCDELSILKEHANRADVFAAAMARHLEIVALALLLALCTGLPLGWAAGRYEPVGQALFPLLNIIQTIPSIALFGLLMAPLALLAASLPALGRAGISGVGMAPGVIALVLYSLLPVARATAAGLAQVPSAVVKAATGIGMSARRVFWQVKVPLALPVVLSGVRTATVQAVGLAAVTALIGAGGLGAIMFEGLFASAPDLVLLGVLPIVAIGVLADALFAGLVGLATPARRASTKTVEASRD